MFKLSKLVQLLAVFFAISVSATEQLKSMSALDKKVELVP
jgi:hypothetical protein